MEVVKKDDFNDEAFEGVTVASLSSSTSEAVSSDTAPLKLASVQGRTTGPTRRSTKGGWTEQEDLRLTKAVKVFNGKNWKKIAECFPGRSDVQCLHRWQKVLNPDLVKGPWTKEEDDRIIELVKEYGCKKWSVIAQSLPGRIGKQCRERWHNHLNPAIKKHAWTKEEELALIRAHQIYGNKWAEIAKFLPGRADNSIKNHWNCSVKKKLDSYVASGYTGDLLGINAFDICNQDGKEESPKVKVSKCDSETVCSLDQNDSDDGIDTSLGVSVLGAANKRQIKVQLHSEPVQIENKGFKEELHCKKESPPALWFECRSPIASGLSSEHRGEEDTNCDSTSVAETEVSCGISDESMMTTHSSMREPVYVSNNSPSHSEEIYLSLSISSDPMDLICGKKKCQSPCATVPEVAKAVHESPKRPRRSANSLHVSGGVRLDLDIGCNTLFPSSSSEDFVSESAQGLMNSNVFTASPQSKNVSPGPLFYEPPKLANPEIFLRNGRFSNTENDIQLTESPGRCFTPPSHMGSNYTNGNSAEAFLRTAAKNFKNTPSIIRKRTRTTCVQDCNAHDSDGVSELRSGSSKGSHGSTHSSDHIPAGHDDLTSTHLLNVKWLSLSSPGLQADTDAPFKSVEKRLEYAFDLEWNNSKAKCSTAAAESDSFCGNSQIMVNSPDSAREPERSNTLMLLDFGVSCNSVI